MTKTERHAYRAVGVDGTATLDAGKVVIERRPWREMRSLFLPWRGQARSRLTIPLDLLEYVELDEHQRRVYFHAPRKRVTRLGNAKARNDRWPFTVTINDKLLPQWRALVTEINVRVNPRREPAMTVTPGAPWVDLGPATSSGIGKMAASGELYAAPVNYPVWPVTD